MLPRKPLASLLVAKTKAEEDMQEAPKFLRAREVAACLGIGLSSVWRWTQEGRLPKPIRLSSRATVWKLDDVLTFVEARKGAGHAEAH